MSHQFEIGELVRCRSAEGPWVGEVVKTTARGLFVKDFASRRPRMVMSNHTLSFARFLHKQTKSRKLKTIYAEFFGGIGLEHMPRRRLRSFHNLLRSYGVIFDEEQTRANDYFSMRADRERLVRRKRAGTALSGEVVSWLPKWLVAEDQPPSSRDPLGLQADAGKLADGLLPGLTVFTSRAGYFFFLPWIVQQINQQAGLSAAQRREMLNRAERGLVLCETLFHDEQGIGDCYHLGQLSKSRLLAGVTTTAVVPERILKNQNNTGCYNLYRNALLSCGVWVEDDEAATRGLLPHRLTPRGQRMAQAFARCEGSEALLRWVSAAEPRPRSVADLRDWGACFCFSNLAKRQKEKRDFLCGFLVGKNDAPEVVRDADRRRQTVETLAKAGLLSPKHVKSQEPASTSIGAGAVSADVPEVELSDSGQNDSVLLHYYAKRSAPGAVPFVKAAVYELLSLALNAIWKGLLDEVAERNRIAIGDWVDSVTSGSGDAGFWNAPLLKAASAVRAPEAVLVKRLSAGKNSVRSGMLLALRVFGRRENQNALKSLADTALVDLIRTVIEMRRDQTARAALPGLVRQLLDRHRDVSERKGKQQWLQCDGRDVWKAEERDVQIVLRFHSYRMPQLMSLMRDLDFERSDLRFD
jgi:hypothetical protein